MCESRIFVFIMLVILTTLAVAPRLEGSAAREFLSGDCRSPLGCQAMFSFQAPQSTPVRD